MAAMALARRSRWLAGAALAGLLFLFVAAGQETPPKKLVPTPTTGPAPLPRTFTSATGKLSGVVELKVLKAGTFDAGEQTAARAFFDLHVKGFSDEEVLPAVGKLRQNLRTYLIMAGNAPAPAVHLWLRQYLFDELKKLVADDKQPMVTRVNALGMIGDLNQREVSPPPPNPPNPAAPPQPLAAVTPYLLEVCENEKMPSALRVVALRGLHRHAQLGLPNPADVATVEAAMLKAVQDSNVPMDCSEPAHEWMRRRAVEILGFLKSPDAAQAIIDIVGDVNLSLPFRCEAARSLGQLTLNQGDPAAGTTAAAQRLGDLAATVAETEADRRALHSYLECVRLGLNGPGRDAKVLGGVRAATPQADAKLANDVFALVEPVAKQIDPNNRSFKDDQVAAAVEELAQKLREIVGAPPARKKAAKTAEPAKGKEAKAAEPGKAKEAKPKSE